MIDQIMQCLNDKLLTINGVSTVAYGFSDDIFRVYGSTPTSFPRIEFELLSDSDQPEANTCQEVDAVFGIAVHLKDDTTKESIANGKDVANMAKDVRQALYKLQSESTFPEDARVTMSVNISYYKRSTLNGAAIEVSFSYSQNI